MTEEERGEAEIAICRKFADSAGFGVLRLEKRRPPEPDILCTLSSGGCVAFELCQAEDITRRGSGEVVSITAIELPQFRLRREFEKSYYAAVATGGIEESKWQYHHVRVTFEDDASEFACRGAMPRVIAFLKDCDPGTNVMKEGVIRSITCKPLLGKAYKGPMLSVNNSALCVGNGVVKGVEKKLGKSYSSAYPIQLIVWSNCMRVDELEFFRGKLLKLLSKGMGQFSRVWVYSCHDSTVVFDSAAYAG